MTELIKNMKLDNLMEKYLIVKRGLSFFKNKLYNFDGYYCTNQKEVWVMSEEEEKIGFYKELSETSAAREEAGNEINEYRNNHLGMFNKIMRVPTVFSEISDELWKKLSKNWTPNDYMIGYKYCQHLLDTTDWSGIITEATYRVKPEFSDEFKKVKEEIYNKYGVENSVYDLKNKYSHKEVVESKRLTLKRVKVTEKPEIFDDLCECLVKVENNYMQEED